MQPKLSKWQDLTLDILSSLDKGLWGSVGLAGGAGVIATHPDQAEFWRLYGKDALTLVFVVLVILNLVYYGLYWWWTRKASSPDSRDRVRETP
jgi:hypothetical protein